VKRIKEEMLLSEPLGSFISFPEQAS